MRIAIVNDVPMSRDVLKLLVEEIGHHEIAWIANNGAEAVKKCAEDIPDLILMDLIMPVMDGVQATRLIMKHTPCAILIVTASVGANASMVFEAMGYGALDVMRTPSVEHIKGHSRGHELKRKIDIVEKYLGMPPLKLRRKTLSHAHMHRHVPPLIVVGASTGGPTALAKMLVGFPANTPYAIVVIQHVDVLFTEGLAEWLSQQTSLKVQLAQEGTRPKPGYVFLAGRDKHLVLTEHHHLGYQDHPAHAPCRPSIDVFFHSVADYWPKESVAVLLTGMGSDGAQGMKALLEKGWYTIAQDQASCVVFGMPKSAIELGAVKEILPLEEITRRILELRHDSEPPRHKSG